MENVNELNTINLKKKSKYFSFGRRGSGGDINYITLEKFQVSINCTLIPSHTTA